MAILARAMTVWTPVGFSKNESVGVEATRKRYLCESFGEKKKKKKKLLTASRTDPAECS